MESVYTVRKYGKPKWLNVFYPKKYEKFTKGIHVGNAQSERYTQFISLLHHSVPQIFFETRAKLI